MPKHKLTRLLTVIMTLSLLAMSSVASAKPKVGPTGPTGPAGPAGTTGPQGPTGPGAPSTTLFTGGSFLNPLSTTLTGSAAGDFMGLYGAGFFQPNVTIANGTALVGVALPAGILSNLHVTLSGPPGGNGFYAFAVCINASCGSPLSCAVFGLQNSCQDDSDTQVVNEGDTVSVISVPVGMPTAQTATWTVEFHQSP